MGYNLEKLRFVFEILAFRSKMRKHFVLRIIIIPLIAEYINDGILTVNDQEKDKAFDAWASLHPVQIVDDEDEDNIDEEDE